MPSLPDAEVAVVQPSPLFDPMEQYDINSSRNRWGCHRRKAVWAVIVFFLVAITLGTTLGILLNDNKSGNEVAHEKNSSYYLQRLTVFRDILDRHFVQPSVFVDLDTPQAKALEWMVYQDENVQIQDYNDDSIVLEKRLVQRWAVMVLFYSCGGESWRGFSTPIDSEIAKHECDHDSFTCRENEEIVAIELSQARVSGQLPAEIGLLTQLTTLHLDGNYLEGPIPDSVYDKLNNLEELFLELNEFSSTISSSISGLTNLRTFSVESNLFTGTLPDTMKELNRLEEVYLSSNDFTGSNIFDLALSWPSLQLLSMYSTQLSGSIPETIGQLTQMKVMFLDYSALEGGIPDSITNLTNLEDFRFGGSHAVGTIPQDIGKLTNLEKLEIYGYGMVGTLPTGLGKLTKLTALGIISAGIMGTIPTEIGYMTNLESLVLQQTQLASTIPDELGKLEHATTFVFRSRGLNGTIPEELCKPGREIRYDCGLTCGCCSGNCVG